jgi:hypothetical protein
LMVSRFASSCFLLELRSPPSSRPSGTSIALWRFSRIKIEASASSRGREEIRKAPTPDKYSFPRDGRSEGRQFGAGPHLPAEVCTKQNRGLF